jgi:hypothetical protein
VPIRFILAGLLMSALLLLLILIMPVRYKLEGRIGAQAQQIEVLAKVSWFFQLFRVLYAYNTSESVFFHESRPIQFASA